MLSDVACTRHTVGLRRTASGATQADQLVSHSEIH